MTFRSRPEGSPFSRGRCQLRRRLGLGSILLQFVQLQLELIEDRAPLRRLTELLMTQLAIEPALVHTTIRRRRRPRDT